MQDKELHRNVSNLGVEIKSDFVMSVISVEFRFVVEIYFKRSLVKCFCGSLNIWDNVRI